jgi:hypothetical protein
MLDDGGLCDLPKNYGRSLNVSFARERGIMAFLLLWRLLATRRGNCQEISSHHSVQGAIAY